MHEVCCPNSGVAPADSIYVELCACSCLDSMVDTPICGRPATVAVTPLAAPAKSLDDNARLSELIIKGHNGSVFDLSPNFQPDVSQYGAMVGADSKDATLCFHTLESESLICSQAPQVYCHMFVAKPSKFIPHLIACTFWCMAAFNQPQLLSLFAVERCGSDLSHMCTSVCQDVVCLVR